MIIDSHCHAGRGDGLSGPWDTAAPLGRYLPRAEVAGIHRTVLLPVFHSDYRVANRELARIVSSHAERFFGYAMVHPSRDAGRVVALVREAVEGFGFRGIKVHRYDGRITREVCEVARTFGLPILYDVMGDASSMDLLATEYPDVSFIVPHLGSFADDWRAHMTLIDVIVRRPNVYTDTSGVRRFDYLVEAVRRAGPGKVLFGSDGPWLHPGLELAKVRALGLGKEDERKILGENWMSLVGRGRRLMSVATPSRSGRAPRVSPDGRDLWAGPQFPV
jgi:uncharacterized protein